VNLRDNSDLRGVTRGQRFNESRGGAQFHKVDGAAAEASAGEARADESGQILRQGHHGVGLGATGFKILL
jgi:hypothetical protein